MRLTDITLAPGTVLPTPQREVDDVASAIGVSRFPEGYREYITTLGAGVLGGCYIRVYPPARIASELPAVRARWAEYWFWQSSSHLLSPARALQCILFADTLDGDELLFHPAEPDRIFVLPRHSETVHVLGPGLFPAIEWLCTSGVLTEPFRERVFEPDAASPPQLLHDLVLQAPGVHRLQVLKVIRTFQPLSLHEAQALLQTGGVIRTGFEDDLRTTETTLVNLGATVAVVPRTAGGA